jgi:murein L,D-transpeptidase YafK
MVVHLLLMVNTKVVKEYVFNTVSLDSDEESETDENEIIVRILKSNESPNIYEKTNSSLVKNGGYDSPTPVDPFARSLNSGDHPLYRKRPTIQKCVFNFLIFHSFNITHP